MERIRIDMIIMDAEAISVLEDSVGYYVMISDIRASVPAHYSANNFTINDVLTFFIDKSGDIAVGLLVVYLSDLIKKRKIRKLKINGKEASTETEINEALGDEKTVSELIKEFDVYQYLGPSFASIDLANEFWDQWEAKSDDITRPDIGQVSANTVNTQHAFFQEVVQMASKVVERPLNIGYCPYLLQDYRLCGRSASDGYVVITDETFFKMLFSLTSVLMFEVNNLIDEHENDDYACLVQRLMDGYINRDSFAPFDKREEPELMQLYGRDYKIAEFGVFLFDSFRIFILAHEIAHHILNHAKGTVEKHFAMGAKSKTILVDNRAYESEYEADVLGYKIFIELMNTVDGSLQHTRCLYRFEFAPLLLFDIFNAMDRRFEKTDGMVIDYKTHPSPLERKAHLLNNYRIDDVDLLYSNLKVALSDFI